MMGVAVMIGSVLTNPDVLNNLRPNLIYGFATGFALTAASMVMNDYYDKDIDNINEPERPIPSGLIRPKEAISLAVVLTVIGFASALVITYLMQSVSCLVIAMIAWLIFVSYTTIGKRSGLPGNFLVSACVSIPFIYGNLSVLDVVQLRVLLFSLIVFLSNTGREITKGIVDAQGDRIKNVKTLAVRYGNRKAAVVAIFFYLLAVTLSPIPWILSLVSFWFVPLVAITDIGLLVSSIMFLKGYSKENARKIKNIVLICFVLGLLAFIAGAVGK
jgi:geranylgeranylglycerol-phosphate geranylgeranyltransferase